MGRDKAPLEVRGRSMLDSAVAAFGGLTDGVLLACGPEARYREAGYEFVLDRFADAGPLAGLEAALQRAAEGGADGAWLLVLACDMPRARGEVFQALLARARERDADACLLGTDGGLEPLYAVYHTRCLGAVRRALEAGERRMTSFHAGYGAVVVEVLDLADLPPAVADRDCHRNVNTPHELEAERGVAG